MKFFARINEEQVGPLTLTELVKAGVRPADYVWHKGLDDWQRADEVPEVCRGMRRYLAGYDPETGELLTAADSSHPEAAEETEAEGTNAAANLSGRAWIRNIPEGIDLTDYSRKPAGVSVVAAILATLLCFPLTGLVAIWYAMKCSAHWKMSCQPELPKTEADNLRRLAHNDARLYKMMMGISFSIGLMMIGFALFK